MEERVKTLDKCVMSVLMERFEGESFFTISEIYEDVRAKWNSTVFSTKIPLSRVKVGRSLSRLNATQSRTSRRRFYRIVV